MNIQTISPPNINADMLKMRSNYPYLLPELEDFEEEEIICILASPLLVPFLMGEEEFKNSNFYPKPKEEQEVIVDPYVNEPDYIWSWGYNGLEISINFRNYKGADPDIWLYLGGGSVMEWNDLEDFDTIRDILLNQIPLKVIEHIFP